MDALSTNRINNQINAVNKIEEVSNSNKNLIANINDAIGELVIADTSLKTLVDTLTTTTDTNLSSLNTSMTTKIAEINKKLDNMTSITIPVKVFQTFGDLVSANKLIDTLYIVVNDDTNKNLPSLYLYINKLLTRFSGGSSDTSIGGGNDSGSSKKQVTKLGVTATSIAPKLVVLDVNQNVEFIFDEINVLKLVNGITNSTRTVAKFSNSDSTDFETNKYVSFETGITFKREIVLDSEKIEVAGLTGVVLKLSTDKTKFKEIVGVV